MSVGLELDLRPGQGVGMFELGSSLWTVFALLQQHKTTLPQVDVKYDSTSPANSPVILHIKPHLDLFFSPLTQRLSLISIRRLRTPGTSLTIKYKDTIVSSCSVSSPGGSPTSNAQDKVFRRAVVNHVFGPTYSGEVMRYPGVWFAFEDDGVVAHTGLGDAAKVGGGRIPEDRALEVKKIVVTQRPNVEDDLRNGPGSSERDTLEEPTECPPMYGDVKKAIVTLPGSLSLYFYTTPPSPPIDIILGTTTAQDLVCDLGAPPRVHYKEDNRMTIHSSAQTPSESGLEESDEGYFYNYFQFGIDCYISGTTHIVQKIILHSNVPGSHLFQRYKRCPWEIERSSVASSTEATEKDPITGAIFVPSIAPAPKKGKKGKSSYSRSPAAQLSGTALDDESEAVASTAERTRKLEAVSLFDKIEVITDYLSMDEHLDPSEIKITKSLGGGSLAVQAAAAGIQGRSPSGPPTMVLDRSSDMASENLNLPNSSTQLIPFEGLILETSELGDVLTVMVV